MISAIVFFNKLFFFLLGKLSVSTATPASAKQQSRPEKKARKALTKLGLKQVVGITKIMIKKNPSVLFSKLC
jgi:hypothetical protein